MNFFESQGGTLDIKKILKENFTAKKLTFLAIFWVLALISQRINFSAVLGADNQFFTLFQFFAPIAGIFLGPVFGILAVLLAETGNFVLNAMPWTVLNMLRLVPILFATYYFGIRNGSWQKRFSILIPVLAIIAFIVHPVGRTVWFFTIFWTIPIIAVILPKKFGGESVFIRSLGATMTAHAAGGALWIWTIPMTAGQWIGLIPVVAYERLLFAAGIGVTFFVFNTVFAMLDEKWTSNAVFIDKSKVLVK